MPDVQGFEMARSVRVEERTYRKLSREAGRLQTQFGRSVSLDETIWSLLRGPREEGRITDLAGTWRVTDAEIRDFERALREGWSRWKVRRSA